MDFESVVDAYEEFKEAVLALSMEFEEATRLFQEAWNHIREVCEEVYDKDTSPRVYGISLLRRDRFQNVISTYRYIPSIPKNLPYQKRCFES